MQYFPGQPSSPWAMWLSVPQQSQLAQSLLSISCCSVRNSQIKGRHISLVVTDSETYTCLSWSQPSRQAPHAEMWKGETNWPQHILTYNKPWALLSDCLYWRPVNSLQVPLSSSAPGSWDHAAQRWQYSGRFLFCVSRGLSEELWKKNTTCLHCCYCSGLKSQPNHEREGEESGKVITPGQCAFPKHHHWAGARFWDWILTLVIP